jgi:hypothetical protein
MAVNRPDPVRNLGHKSKSTEAALTKSPVGRVMNYDTAPQAERQIKEGQRLTQGVYVRHVPIKSGISSEQNLDQWARYAKSNSYHRGPGPGKDPPQSDDSRRLVPPAAHNKDSDGYLESTRNWPSFDTGGADSGVGRLEKSKKY